MSYDLDRMTSTTGVVDGLNKEPRRKQRGIGETMSDYNITPQAAGNLPEEIKKAMSS